MDYTTLVDVELCTDQAVLDALVPGNLYVISFDPVSYQSGYKLYVSDRCDRGTNRCIGCRPNHSVEQFSYEVPFLVVETPKRVVSLGDDFARVNSLPVKHHEFVRYVFRALVIDHVGFIYIRHADIPALVRLE